MRSERSSRAPSKTGDALAQVGACGLFLFQILAAIPGSLRHIRETIRQIWFVGAMSLVIIMTCGLFVGMVLGLQLYYVLSIFGGTAALGSCPSWTGASAAIAGSARGKRMRTVVP